MSSNLVVLLLWIYLPPPLESLPTDNRYYLIDQSITNISIPSLISNDNIFNSIGDVWNNILSSFNATVNGTSTLNMSNPKNFIFNVTILSDLTIPLRSYATPNIYVPEIVGNINNYPITLNIDCMRSSPCTINIFNGSSFIAVQASAHAPKLILSIQGWARFLC